MNARLTGYLKQIQLLFLTGKASGERNEIRAAEKNFGPVYL